MQSQNVSLFSTPYTQYFYDYVCWLGRVVVYKLKTCVWHRKKRNLLASFIVVGEVKPNEPLVGIPKAIDTHGTKELLNACVILDRTGKKPDVEEPPHG